MSEITDALAQLATILDGLSTNPENVWVWETQYSSIDLSTLPVIVVSQGLVTWHSVSRGNAFSRGTDATTADIQIFLERGFLTPTKVESGSSAPGKAHKWVKPMFDELTDTSNKNLNNTVLSLGNEQGLFRYIIANLLWKDDHYWGIYAQLPMVIEYI